MDPEDLRSLLRDSGADLWTLIDAAITVAARDHGDELRARRDGIVERLYTKAAAVALPQPQEQAERFQNCDPDEDLVGAMNRRIRSNGREEEKGSSSPVAKRGGGNRSPPTPQSMNREERVEDDDDDEDDGEEEDRGRSNGRDRAGDAKSKIMAIKEFLDDEDKSEDQVASLLQNLADLDVTFKVLEDTDIGRHVNRLRKHPSGEVRRLVKLIVRKWKVIVDDYVKSHSAGENASPANMTDGDSPLQIHGSGNQNGQQVADFGYSPNPHNGVSEQVEFKAKAAVVARRESLPAPPLKQNQSMPTPPSRAVKEQKDKLLDPERLASARKRLQENYQEAQNAKKQRTIQVMDIHDIPKAKNTFVARNKTGGGGGGGSHHQGKHW